MSDLKTISELSLELTRVVQILNKVKSTRLQQLKWLAYELATHIGLVKTETLLAPLLKNNHALAQGFQIVRENLTSNFFK